MRNSVIESECRSPARAAAIEWSVPSSRIADGVESRLPWSGVSARRAFCGSRLFASETPPRKTR